MESTIPCRLSLVYNPASDRAVVLRRGPSRWTRMISWDLNADLFEFGQWLHGTVPANDCDITPNGKYISCYVSSHKKRKPYFWVSVSKPPYFSALSTWLISAQGGRCYFNSNNELNITPGIYPEEFSLMEGYNSGPLKVTSIYQDNVPKLKRNGWHFIVPVDYPSNYSLELLERLKPSPLNPNLILKCIKKTYQLTIHKKTLVLVDIVDIDWDKRGHLFGVSSTGNACRIIINDKHEININNIYNFNDMMPEDILPTNESLTW